VTTFNSPPGWPAPPEGWTPPPGWKPDPSWPPAPAGWQFYSTDEQTAELPPQPTPVPPALPPSAPIGPPGATPKRRKWPWIAAAIVGVLVVAVIANSGKKNTANKSRAAASTTATPSHQASSSATSTATETATASPTPTALPMVPTIHLVGTGDKIAKISIPSGEARIAVAKHDGQANFIVSPLDPHGGNTGGLINTIGAYTGTTLLSADSGIGALQIQADGHWTIDIRDIRTAAGWSPSAPTKGRGDQVLLLKSPLSDLASFKITHIGESNFIVTAWGDTNEGLVNEIGKYTGSVLVPASTVLLEIQADGAWTITPE
jgi:hypothetical protein